MNQFIKDCGHCCNTCRYYDAMSGYCKKTNSYHHGYDFDNRDGGESCPKWKIAKDLIEHRQKKKKKYIQVKLDI